MKRLVITNYCILELQNISLQHFGRQIQLRQMSEANSMSSDHDHVYSDKLDPLKNWYAYWYAFICRNERRSIFRL
jgi:hypothetical protein